MINIVKELIKGQEERRAEYEKGFNVERVSLAQKLIAELRESLVELKCEYLLDNVDMDKVDTSKLEAQLVSANNEIKALKDRCKEISTLKAQTTKAIKAKEKAIQDKNDAVKINTELTKKLEAMTKTAATWQSKHDSVVKELNDKIKSLQEELAQKEKEVSTLQQAALCYETTKNNKIEKEVVKEVKNKEESNEEYFKLNANVKFKSGNLYESKDHYVIAKTNIKDLVVVPKKLDVNVEEADYVKYEDLLVNKFNFNKDRQLISPVTVDYKDAKYQARLVRTEAKGSLFQFSHQDVLAGFIVNNYKVYSWSWNPSIHETPCVLDLGQKAKGSARYQVSPCDRKALIEVIEKMKKEYDVKVEAYCEANNKNNITKERVEESVNQTNSRIAALLGYEEETRKIAESAQKPQVVVNNNNEEVKKNANKPQNNFSASLNSFVDEMFS